MEKAKHDAPPRQCPPCKFRRSRISVHIQHKFSQYQIVKMKKLTILLIGLIVSLTIACKKHQPEYDKDITLVIDRTDKMTAYPTAQGIILVLDFEGHPWQAVRVTVTNISATDINNSTTISLAGESEWMGNLDIRK